MSVVTFSWIIRVGLSAGRPRRTGRSRRRPRCSRARPRRAPPRVTAATPSAVARSAATTCAPPSSVASSFQLLGRPRDEHEIVVRGEHPRDLQSDAAGRAGHQRFHSVPPLGRLRRRGGRALRNAGRRYSRRRGRLARDGGAVHRAAVAGEVGHGHVLHRAVVPDRDVADAPLPAAGERPCGWCARTGSRGSGFAARRGTSRRGRRCTAGSRTARACPVSPCGATTGWRLRAVRRLVGLHRHARAKVSCTACIFGEYALTALCTPSRPASIGCSAGESVS